ncbi:MAG: hypothetical protein V4676_12600 [Bacteroidota bacterium]
MNHYIFLLAIIVCLTSCSSKKKKESGEEIFPVSSFLQAQVKHVDTSLYRIVKVEKEDTNSIKTYVPREEFRKLANEFLQMPDIASDKWQDDYEETKMMDDNMNAILSYNTTEKDNEVQRQDIILEPSNGQNAGKVKTIIAYLLKNNSDSSVIKNMVWYVNKRFTIVTKTQKSNQPQKVKTLEVIWNDFTDQ